MRVIVIETSWDYELLSNKVNMRLMDGWTCCGGVALTGSDGGGYTYAQAMVKFGLKS